MPQNYPGISFDGDGVCNYCVTYKKAKYKGKGELDEFLDSFRSRDGRYDCVLGISGGRDSSYALHYLVKQCNLKVLAYNADNGFLAAESKINMKRITKILGVKLITEKHDFLQMCIRHSLSSWLRRPSPAMIPMICCGCRFGMFRGLLRCAKMNRIPLVVLGAGSKIEANRFKQEFLATNRLGRILGPRHKMLSLLLGLCYEIARNPLYLLSPINTTLYIAEYIYFFHLERVRRLFYPDQTVLFLYEYIDWDEDRILSTVESELNWTKPPEAASSWRSDCEVAFLKNYLLREIVGFTEKDDMLSNMIREGMITREEALERAHTENLMAEKMICERFGKIGMSVWRV